MPQRTVASSGPQGFTTAAFVAAARAAIFSGGSITASDIQGILNAVNAFASHYHVVNDIGYAAYGNKAPMGSTTTDHNTYAVTGFSTHSSPIAQGADIVAADVNNLKVWVNAIKAPHNHLVDDVAY